VRSEPGGQFTTRQNVRRTVPAGSTYADRVDSATGRHVPPPSAADRKTVLSKVIDFPRELVFET
jgi:hypothetical protein